MSEAALGIVGTVVVAMYAIYKGARLRLWFEDRGIDIDPRDKSR